MADKFLQLDLTTGKTKAVEATVVSTGATEAGDLVALDNTGKLDASVMPVGIGADTKAIIASEDLAAGDFVNIYDNAGTPNVRKADATTSGKEAVGFVLAAVTAGNTATVYFEGTNNQVTGLTIGGRCYLSTTAGGVIQDVSAYTAGNVVQYLGVAVSATEIAFEGDDGIEI